jgi:nitrite reductase (NADH) small subunit/3-phenylpropionate/trans-cinnamate dioxygenase ferredoxin subunit
MMDDGFVTVAKTGEIPDGEGRSLRANGRAVALFRVGDEYFALDDCCPHMGAPLGLGDVHEGHVVCDRHLWSFRLADGVCTEAPRLKAETFPVRVHNGEIQVQLSKTNP